MIISLFPNSKETLKHENIELLDFLQKIKDGEWQDLILDLRTEKDPEDFTTKKRNLPNATISGNFSRRAEAGLEKHSGFLAIDIDKLGEQLLATRDALQSDDLFYAMFVSCSGKGLCGIVKIDPDKHKLSYKQIGEYLQSVYGIKIDPQCNNLSRTRYVTYDPDLYTNTDSITFQTKKPQAKAKAEPKDYLIVPEDFHAVVKEMVERQIDVTGEYDQWIKLGFSIATSFGEDGREQFHALSEINPDYDYDQCDTKYDNFLETKTGDITICWFYDLIKKDYNIKAYSPRTEAVLRAAQAAFDFNIADGVEGVKQLLRDKHGFSEEDVANADELIAQAIKKRVPIGGDSLIADVEAFIYQRFDIKKNTLIDTIEVDGRKISQTKLNTIYIDTAKIYDKASMAMIRAMINTDSTPTYNPFDDLINKYLLNPPPNPRGHIAKMIASVITDTPNADYFIKKWMVAMIPSAKGEHSVLMLVFSGALNSGKTEWFRRYLPDCLKQYRADNSLEEGKDSDILMSKKLLILDDEMGGKTKAEEKKMKNMTSKQEMTVRKPYDSEESELNRIAMLCGTTNVSDILNDPTGNRRILPINVLDIDKDLYNSIDKELVLFECYLEWKAGYNTKLTNADIKLLKDSSDNFIASNFTDELFDKHFGHPDEYPGYPETPMTVTEIFIFLNTMGAGNRIETKRLIARLHTGGYSLKRSGKRRDWCVVKIDPEMEVEI